MLQPTGPFSSSFILLQRQLTSHKTLIQRSGLTEEKHRKYIFPSTIVCVSMRSKSWEKKEKQTKRGQWCSRVHSWMKRIHWRGFSHKLTQKHECEEKCCAWVKLVMLAGWLIQNLGCGAGILHNSFQAIWNDPFNELQTGTAMGLERSDVGRCAAVNDTLTFLFSAQAASGYMLTLRSNVSLWIQTRLKASWLFFPHSDWTWSL